MHRPLLIASLAGSVLGSALPGLEDRNASPDTVVISSIETRVITASATCDDDDDDCGIDTTLTTTATALATNSVVTTQTAYATTVRTAGADDDDDESRPPTSPPIPEDHSESEPSGTPPAPPSTSAPIVNPVSSSVAHEWPTLLPAVPGNQPNDSLDSLTPTTSSTLTFTLDGASDPSTAHLFAKLTANHTTPGLVLEHSAQIADIRCADLGLKVDLATAAALDFARAAWAENFIAITSSADCGGGRLADGSSSGHHSYWNVTAVSYPADTLTALLDAVEIDVHDFLDHVHLVWGTHVPQSGAAAAGAASAASAGSEAGSGVPPADEDDDDDYDYDYDEDYDEDYNYDYDYDDEDYNYDEGGYDDLDADLDDFDDSEDGYYDIDADLDDDDDDDEGAYLNSDAEFAIELQRFAPGLSTYAFSDYEEDDSPAAVTGIGSDDYDIEDSGVVDPDQGDQLPAEAFDKRHEKRQQSTRADERYKLVSYKPVMLDYYGGGSEDRSKLHPFWWTEEEREQERERKKVAKMTSDVERKKYQDARRRWEENRERAQGASRELKRLRRLSGAGKTNKKLEQELEAARVFSSERWETQRHLYSMMKILEKLALEAPKKKKAAQSAQSSPEKRALSADPPAIQGDQLLPAEKRQDMKHGYENQPDLFGYTRPPGWKSPAQPAWPKQQAKPADDISVQAKRFMDAWAKQREARLRVRVIETDYRLSVKEAKAKPNDQEVARELKYTETALRLAEAKHRQADRRLRQLGRSGRREMMIRMSLSDDNNRARLNYWHLREAAKAKWAAEKAAEREKAAGAVQNAAKTERAAGAVEKRQDLKDGYENQPASSSAYEKDQKSQKAELADETSVVQDTGYRAARANAKEAALRVQIARATYWYSLRAARAKPEDQELAQEFKESEADLRVTHANLRQAQRIVRQLGKSARRAAARKKAADSVKTKRAVPSTADESARADPLAIADQVAKDMLDHVKADPQLYGQAKATAGGLFGFLKNAYDQLVQAVSDVVSKFSTVKLDYPIPFNFSLAERPAPGWSVVEDTPWGEQVLMGSGTKDVGSGRAEVSYNLYCVDCGFTALIHIAGEISFSVSERKLTKGSITVEGRDMVAKLFLGLEGFYQDTYNYEDYILEQAIPPGFSIPKIITMGPAIRYGVRARLDLEAEGMILAGAEVHFSNFNATFDLVDDSKRSFAGLEPTYEPVIEAYGAIRAGFRLGYPYTLGITMHLPMLKKDTGVTITNEPYFKAEASYGDDKNCSKGIAYQTYVGNDVYANLLNLAKVTISKLKGPPIHSGCEKLPPSVLKLLPAPLSALYHDGTDDDTDPSLDDDVDSLLDKADQAVQAGGLVFDTVTAGNGKWHLLGEDDGTLSLVPAVDDDDNDDDDASLAQRTFAYINNTVPIDAADRLLYFSRATLADPALQVSWLGLVDDGVGDALGDGGGDGDAVAGRWEAVALVAVAGDDGDEDGGDEASVLVPMDTLGESYVPVACVVTDAASGYRGNNLFVVVDVEEGMKTLQSGSAEVRMLARGDVGECVQVAFDASDGI